MSAPLERDASAIASKFAWSQTRALRTARAALREQSFEPYQDGRFVKTPLFGVENIRNFALCTSVDAVENRLLRFSSFSATLCEETQYDYLDSYISETYQIDVRRRAGKNDVDTTVRLHGFAFVDDALDTTQINGVRWVFGSEEICSVISGSFDLNDEVAVDAHVRFADEDGETNESTQRCHTFLTRCLDLPVDTKRLLAKKYIAKFTRRWISDAIEFAAQFARLLKNDDGKLGVAMVLLVSLYNSISMCSSAPTPTTLKEFEAINWTAINIE